MLKKFSLPWVMASIAFLFLMAALLVIVLGDPDGHHRFDIPPQPKPLPGLSQIVTPSPISWADIQSVVSDRLYVKETTTPQSVVTLPVSLDIPSLSIDAPVTGSAVLPDRSLSVPDNVKDVGAWINPTTGTTVFVSHVDSAKQGLGVFYPIRTLKIGAEIETGGKVFHVTRVQQVSKADLPESAFTTPGVTLITCGGIFDSKTHHYTDNIVVYAT